MKAYIDGVKSLFGEPPFKIGDKVTFKEKYYSYRRYENDIVRTVTDVRYSTTCHSNWQVSVDGGSPCPCCGLTPGNKAKCDSGWFKKFQPKENVEVGFTADNNARQKCLCESGMDEHSGWYKWNKDCPIHGKTYAVMGGTSAVA